MTHGTLEGIYTRSDHCKLGEKIILATNIDISCLCETFLQKDDEVEITGYQWFGNN